jgi:hypothetical protein
LTNVSEQSRIWKVALPNAAVVALLTPELTLTICVAPWRLLGCLSKNELAIGFLDYFKAAFTEPVDNALRHIRPDSPGAALRGL